MQWPYKINYLWQCQKFTFQWSQNRSRRCNTKLLLTLSMSHNISNDLFETYDHVCICICRGKCIWRCERPFYISTSDIFRAFVPLYRICLAQEWKPTECIESFAWTLISVVARDQKKTSEKERERALARARARERERERERKREKREGGAEQKRMWTIGCAYTCAYTNTRITFRVPKSLYRITYHVTSRYVHACMATGRWLIFVPVILFCNRADESRSEREKESAVEVSHVRENHRIRSALSHSRALDHEFHLSGRNILLFLNTCAEREKEKERKSNREREREREREEELAALCFHSIYLFFLFFYFYRVVINFQKARRNEMRLTSNIPMIYIYSCLLKYCLTNAWIIEAKIQRGVYSFFTIVELRLNYASISILVYSLRNQNRNC